MRMRLDGGAPAAESLHARHHVVVDRLEAIPPLAQHAHDATRLDDLDMAVLVHRVMHEQVSGKQRRLDTMRQAAAGRPRHRFGQQHLKALSTELVADELLAMTSGPDRVPRCLGRWGAES